ncbi:MAG: hypothetical protein R3281_17655, partial [Balneolaceae bacterium]|nr:hypothetical protein [Balneolaceae bacterium]
GYFTYQNYQKIDRLNRQITEQQETRQPADGVAQAPETSQHNRSPDAGTTPEQDSDVVNRTNPESGQTVDQSLDETNSPAAAAEQHDGPETAGGTEFDADRPAPEDLNRQIGPQYAHSAVRSLPIQELPCPECRFVSSSGIDTGPIQFPVAGARGTPALPAFGEASRGTRGRPAAIVPESQETASTRSSGPLAVGFIFGPDLSSAGSFANFTDPGFQVGLALQYRVFDHLSISTGVVHSSVNYLAGRDDYRPPYGYWTNGIAADQTAAQCAILEIPVSITYDVMQFSESALYASAGLSSYIMLSEEYRFRYTNPDPSLVSGWSGETGSRHWFSNATFSAGYEFTLFENWSLRAGPYLKLPLKRVGWGNVELYSVGTSISLNFGL